MSKHTYTPYIYKITNKETGQFYIGSRTAKGCHPYEFWNKGGYFTSSSNPILKGIKDRPNEWSNWTPEIIQQFEGIDRINDRSVVIFAEHSIIQEQSENPLCLNQHFIDPNTASDVFSIIEHSEETKAKISRANKGKVRSEESRRRLSEANKGKVLTEEHKKSISKGWHSKPEEERNEIIRRNVAKKIQNGTLKLRQETKDKISNARKGMKFTEEHCANIGKANKERITKMWVIESPDGTVYRCFFRRENVKKFCDENELAWSPFIYGKVYNQLITVPPKKPRKNGGRRKNTTGWKFIKYDLTKGK